MTPLTMTLALSSMFGLLDNPGILLKPRMRFTSFNASCKSTRLEYFDFVFQLFYVFVLPTWKSSLGSSIYRDRRSLLDSLCFLYLLDPSRCLLIKFHCLLGKEGILGVTRGVLCFEVINRFH